MCVDYDPAAFQSSDDVRLLHGERDSLTGTMQWVDRTTRVDATTHSVCATVSSLSPFAVAERNRPPTARATASAATLDEGGSVTFDASTSTDADGTIASYAWSFDGGATFTPANASPTVSHTFPQDGVQSVVVRVSDDRGATGTSSLTVSVANVLPTVSVAGPLNPVALSGGRRGQLSWCRIRIRIARSARRVGRMRRRSWRVGYPADVFVYDPGCQRGDRHGDRR